MDAIVLLSSGLDSVTSLWWARNWYNKLYTITFQYGIKEERVSIKCAKRLSDMVSATHNIIELPWLGEFSKYAGSTLVTGKKVPQPDEESLDNLEKASMTAKSVWIPARNLVFLSVATSFAESLQSEEPIDIITGFDKEEAVTFPDNSKRFIENFNATIEFATFKKEIKVVCPLIENNKTEIIKTGITLDVPFEYSNSCYEPQGTDENGHPIHCGKCESCMRRKRAFREAGIEDPTVYIG